MSARKPCRECPFLRTSAPGWLGPFSSRLGGDVADPEAFLSSFADGERRLPCHMAWERDHDADEVETCVGSLIYLRNHAKLPRDRALHAELETVEPDTGLVFLHRAEFCAHHLGESDG